MSANPFGGTIHRALLSLTEAVEQEDVAPSEEAAEFSHLLAEKSGVFRLWLDAYLGLFPLLELLNAQWKMGILRGESGYGLDQEAYVRFLFNAWLGLSDPMRQRIEFFERHNLPSRSGAAEELTRYSQKASTVLASWQPPTLARCKALRIRYVTPEEAGGLSLPVE